MPEFWDWGQNNRCGQVQVLSENFTHRNYDVSVTFLEVSNGYCSANNHGKALTIIRICEPIKHNS